MSTAVTTTELAAVTFRTRSGAELVIRACQGHAELDACVDLQQATWGYPDLEVAPRKLFLLAQELGGQVIGAFEPGSGQLVGFAMAMAAFHTTAGAPPQPYLHSHMLAVRPEYRDSGLGSRLKFAQRDDALARGITRMTWTFDPLAAKNAYLNLHRLGAIARRYSPDFYGVSSSRLQGGLPTDRLHAEWWLDSPRVRAVAEGRAQAPVELSGTRFVELSPLVSEWKQEESDAALQQVLGTQSQLRRVFEQAFAQGWAVVDFDENRYKLVSAEQLHTVMQQLQ